MPTPGRGLLAALGLSSADADDTGDAFVGQPQWMPHGRVFGGQAMAQALLAAVRTVAPDRLPHSMHGYFLRPGDVAEPIAYAVDRIHDGRSFSTRRTQASQRGLPILSMIASFQTADEGLDHAEPAPDVPDPEELPADDDILAEVEHPFARHWATGRPFEMRHVEQPVFAEPAPPHARSQAVWLRAREPLPDDEALHRAALAYASDYTILESVMRAHGVTWSRPDLKMASLDHAMWWHRPARADEWFLYAQTSPNAVGGRGLATGRMYTRDRMLIASVAQEGMLRVGGTRS